ncbi:MAG: amidohydrolase family protein [Balneolaceae bacterium]|nr:amidohydrolase family protein [Balneolaceae bacterium]
MFTFARLLAKYVREEQVISLEEAIRKLTSLPASNLKIEKRGKLEPGYFADVVIFNPETIQDHATFQEPYQLATGVEHVFVNGVQVLKTESIPELCRVRLFGDRDIRCAQIETHFSSLSINSLFSSINPSILAS